MCTHRFIMKRTSKQMVERWNKTDTSIINDNLSSIRLTPNYYTNLIERFDKELIEKRERFFDVGVRSELMFKVNKIKKELEVIKQNGNKKTN